MRLASRYICLFFIFILNLPAEVGVAAGVSGIRREGEVVYLCLVMINTTQHDIYVGNRPLAEVRLVDVDEESIPPGQFSFKLMLLKTSSNFITRIPAGGHLFNEICIGNPGRFDLVQIKKQWSETRDGLINNYDVNEITVPPVAMKQF